MTAITKISTRFYAWLLIVCGALGLLSSYVITLDKLKLTENPRFVPSCNINPIISCGSVMKTAQSNAFGFPNSWIGLAAFAAVLVVGVSMLAGADFKSWYWRLFNLGMLLGVIFIHWLFIQTVWVIHALCPWCMLTWVVTIAVFWFTTIYNLQNGHWPTPKSLKPVINFIYEYKYLLLFLWYLIIAVLILHHFWYYYGHDL